VNVLINLDYRNEDWLYQQYTIQQKAIREIGRCCGVSGMTVLLWLEKFCILRRTISEAKCVFYNKASAFYRDGDLLYKKYIEEKRSRRKLAEICKVDKSTILDWLRKYDIPVRTLSDAGKNWFGDNVGYWLGRVRSNETKGKIASSLIGNELSKEARKKISAKLQGIKLNEWTHFVSFEPYCYRFNFEKKEEIRNRDNRVCQLCGKSEIENGRRLSFHHIDGDKMQGCNGRSWYLVSLCLACNSWKDTLEKEFTIVVNSNIRRK